MVSLDIFDDINYRVRLLKLFLIASKRFLFHIHCAILLSIRLQALQLKIENEKNTYQDTEIKHLQGTHQKKLPQKKAEVKLAPNVFLVFLR